MTASLVDGVKRRVRRQLRRVLILGFARRLGVSSVSTCTIECSTHVSATRFRTVKVTATLLTLLGALALSAVLTPLVRALAAAGGFLASRTATGGIASPFRSLADAPSRSRFRSPRFSTPLAPLTPLLVGHRADVRPRRTRRRPPLRGHDQAGRADHHRRGRRVYLMPPAHITGIAPVDGLLSLVWIVGITNAFNLLDNIDGLSAGIAAIAGIFLLAALSPSGGDAAVPGRRGIRGRGAGIPHLQRAAGVDLHGRQRQPVPRRRSSAVRRCSRRPSSRPASSRWRRSRSFILLDPDLRHGVRERDAPAGRPQPAARRARSPVAPAGGARHRRAARGARRSTCWPRSAASSP